MARKTSQLDRLLGRIEDLDSTNLAVLVQRLARERALLEAVFHVVREGILVLGDSGVIEYANEAACGLIGLNPRDIGVATLWKLVPELAHSLGNYFNMQAAARPVTISRELEVHYPEKRLLRLYLVPLEAGEDAAERLQRRSAVILSDVTRESARTHELIESEKLDSLYELAAGVAHEIGNPLNSITIHLQLIKRKLSKISAHATAPDDLGKSIDVCTQEVARLDGILTHFLKAIRPVKPDLRDVELVPLVMDVLKVLGQELTDAGIQVAVDPGSGLPPVLGDPDQLKQVFYNVLKNAMEAMRPGGRHGRGHRPGGHGAHFSAVLYQ